MAETLNSFLKKIETYCSDNQLVNDFGYGQISDLDASVELKYPLIWCDTDSATFNGPISNVNIIFKVLDIQRDNQDNKRDVDSDTLRIAKDLYNYLYITQFDNFEIDINSSLTKINEAYPTVLNGWEIQCSVQIFDDLNTCDIPLFKWEDSYVRFLFDGRSSADTVVGDSSKLIDWNTTFNSNFKRLFDDIETYTLYEYFGTIIEDEQFANINIYEIEDLNTIYKIGDRSFQDSTLNSIYLTECVSIGENAFQNCPLDTIYLPKVESFGTGCFVGVNGRTITLTIKKGMEDDPSITQLINTNTVTLILV